MSTIQAKGGLAKWETLELVCTTELSVFPKGRFLPIKVCLIKVSN